MEIRNKINTLKNRLKGFFKSRTPIFVFYGQVSYYDQVVKELKNYFENIITEDKLYIPLDISTAKHETFAGTLAQFLLQLAQQFMEGLKPGEMHSLRDAIDRLKRWTVRDESDLARFSGFADDEFYPVITKICKNYSQIVFSIEGWDQILDYGAEICSYVLDKFPPTSTKFVIFSHSSNKPNLFLNSAANFSSEKVEYVELSPLISKRMRFEKIGSLPNPYDIQNPLPTNSDLFVGRESIVKSILEQIESNAGGKIIVIWGDEKIGKTSLLNQLKGRIKNRREVADMNIHLLVLLGSRSSAKEFIRGMADEIRRTLGVPEDENLPLPSTAEWFSNFLSNVPTNKGLVVFCDGYEALNKNFEEEGFREEVLSAFYALASTACLLFTGSVDPEKSFMLKDFFRGADKRKLVPLNADEASSLLQKPAQHFFSYEKDALGEIHKLTGGFPYFIQAFGLACFERFKKNPAKRKIVQDDIKWIWEEALLNGKVESLWNDSLEKAFVLMPFKKTFSSFYSDVYKPALEDLGYYVWRADDSREPGPIIDDILKSIARSNLILCDLSELNSNVLYELGFADAHGKPVILVLRKKELKTIPFDLRHRRIILYEPQKSDRNKLKDEIKSMARKFRITGKIVPPTITKTSNVKKQA